MLRMLIEKSKLLLPEERVGVEVLGFAVVACGIFFGLALITYDPTDSIKLFVTGATYENMVGPAGAWLADFLLSTFGLISLPIAVILCFWGGLMALGFVRWPKTKRLVGFALVLAVLCGAVHLEAPDPQATQLSHGMVGAIGATTGERLPTL